MSTFSNDMLEARRNMREASLIFATGKPSLGAPSDEGNDEPPAGM
jgi:hypothetical protein